MGLSLMFLFFYVQLLYILLLIIFPSITCTFLVAAAVIWARSGISGTVWVWQWRSLFPLLLSETQTTMASQDSHHPSHVFHRSAADESSMFCAPQPADICPLQFFYCCQSSVLCFQMQRIISPETDSGFGSSYLTQSASGELNLLTGR